MMKKNFKALVLADNKTQTMDFILDYASDAYLSSNWTLTETTIEDVEYDIFDCDYLIQTTDAPHIIYLDDIQNYLDFL